MASKPIVVELTKAVEGYGPKGATFGYDSEAKAASVLGEGAFKVLRHQDGGEVEPRKAAKSDAKKDEGK